MSEFGLSFCLEWFKCLPSYFVEREVWTLREQNGFSFLDDVFMIKKKQNKKKKNPNFKPFCFPFSMHTYVYSNT